MSPIAGSKPRDYRNEPIAIVGSGFRFPGGADTPSKLWDLLREPCDVQSAIPGSRFNPNGFFHPSSDHYGTMNVRHGYFLREDIQHFDNQFFGIKPVEASSMDPQQRILLEVIYEGIEAAGLSVEVLRGSPTAVFVGLMAVDYNDLLNRDTSSFPSYVAAGTARSMLANRVSYFFDWRGPSMTIDTACSSSLVAVHQAVQSLRSGEAHVAVAAGANLVLGPEQFIAGSKMKMLSRDGRSYMWDARANGYARGEGVVAVILKTLTAAIADGDDIESLIVETGLNQDGKTNGLTVPSATAQAKLIDATYKKAGLDLTKTSDRPQYFEAHGTGTPIGDPLEAEAIQRAFFKNVESRHVTNPLYLGSIKTVIGHTEGAAGLAGLIKASLALNNGIIPPNLLFENLAPAVKPFFKNLEIALEAKPWPELENGGARRASVNSFGFGGTNAHCIMESYTPEKKVVQKKSQVYTPFVFSAISEKALVAMVASHSSHLKSDPSINLRALSHTLCNKRKAFAFRVAFSARDAATLCAKLDAFVESIDKNPTIAIPISSSPVRILGIFTGQGAQWKGMASRLMALPVSIKIVEELERSLSQLKDPPSWSLKSELSADQSSSRIMEAAIAQPACTALQILLVELLRAAGISFSAVVGHSSGEIGAAYAAGYLSARDAIRIAYYRGVHLRLVQGRNGENGSMIAIGASYEEAQNICSSEDFCGRICVAASNSASSVTLAGDTAAIETVQAMFNAKKKFARLLRVDNAYHSHHMIACSEAITASLRMCGIRSFRPTHPNCMWVSSVYQQDISSVTDDLNDIYWHNNSVGPVLFSQALEYALAEARFDLAIEVGAHPALKGPASQVIEETLGQTIPYTGLLSRNMDDVEAFSSGLGYVWANLSSSVVDFAKYDRFLNNSEAPRVLKGLPKYPWDHQRTFWHESRVSKTYRHRRTHHELLGAKSPNFSEDQVSWTGHLIPKELSWIAGHRIQGQMIFPGSGYMSSAFEAAREIAANQPLKLIELTNFVFGQPLIFDTEETRVEVLVSLTNIRFQNSSLSAKFSYYSVPDGRLGPMALNASCQLHVIFGDYDAQTLQPNLVPNFGMTEVSAEQIYSSFASCGYDYTGPFKALSSVERKLGTATGLVQVPYAESRTRYLIHPAALDAAMHSILVAHCYPGDGRLVSVLLPTNISKIAINPVLAINSSCTQTLRFLSYSRNDGKRDEGDVDLYPADGSNALLQIEGLFAKPMIQRTAANDIQIFSETVWGPAAPLTDQLSNGLNDSQSSATAYSSVLTGFVKQMSHRYPAMNIVEINARTGSVTNCILEALNGAFASYTFTDIHANHLEQAQEAFKAYETKFVYKTLDINKDVVSQGYKKHSFALAFGSLVLSSMDQLEKVMRNIRKLLKPGGYLLLLMVTDESQITSSPCLSGLSEREFCHRIRNSPLPHVGTSDWKILLQRHCFAGVESIAGQATLKLPTHRLIIAQAVDNRIDFLHDPLKSKKELGSLPKITLVGGDTIATARCLSDLTNILHDLGGEVTLARQIRSLATIGPPFGGTVVTLQDHDQPLFENFDEKKLQGMQQTFEMSKNVLWVTCGYKHNLPYARMMVAFARCLLLEMPHIRLQILDLPSSEALDATLISNHVLRLLATESWEEQGSLDDILWSLEPEIYHENGRDLIPRLKPSKALNNRYNSAYRQIIDIVDLSVTPVTLASTDRNYILTSKSEKWSVQSARGTDDITICVVYSFLKTVKIGTFGYLYLILGINSATDEQVIALSSSLSSVIRVRKEWVQSCPLSKGDAVKCLTTLFYGLIATTILQNLDQGDGLLVLEPEKSLATVIESLATPRGIEAVFFTAVDSSDRRGNWKYVQSRAPKREIDSVLPQQLSQVVCWKDNEWTFMIKNNIPDDTRVKTLGSYVAARASFLQTSAAWGVSDIFNAVWCQRSLLNSLIEAEKIQTVSLLEVHNISWENSSATLIDWMVSSKVPLTVEPVDSRPMFRSDRTYWLVGLTGGLGLSLCQWMISRGAKFIVISSRSPNVDPHWFAHFNSLSATVRVYANDITDRASVRSLYSKILVELPPIAGVCQGAMVLQDALLHDLSMAQVEKVLKPKVDGAVHLDEIFRYHSLDFFVMLSSIAAVIGNPGQAIYAAANGYLAGLATQRRARGVAASTVNLGAIIGNGYLTREFTFDQQKALQIAGIMWTSEQDFHQAFAEAVLASPPLSGRSAELCTGVRICYADETNQPRHATSPIFSHLMVHRKTPELSADKNQAAASVKVRLLQATTTEDVHVVLADFLSLRLKKALQMSQDADVINQTADALGIDSLVAVEMRSWFLKDLSIDMPMLKIIGGGTMRDVLEKARELYEVSITSSLAPRPTSNEGTALGAAKAKTESIIPSVNSGKPEFRAANRPAGQSPCIRTDPVPIITYGTTDYPGLEAEDDCTASAKYDATKPQLVPEQTKSEVVRESHALEQIFMPETKQHDPPTTMNIKALASENINILEPSIMRPVIDEGKGDCGSCSVDVHASQDAMKTTGVAVHSVSSAQKDSKPHQRLIRQFLQSRRLRRLLQRS